MAKASILAETRNAEKNRQPYCTEWFHKTPLDSYSLHPEQRFRYALHYLGGVAGAGLGAAGAGRGIAGRAADVPDGVPVPDPAAGAFLS